jgi:hypothetical protein
VPLPAEAAALPIPVQAEDAVGAGPHRAALLTGQHGDVYLGRLLKYLKWIKDGKVVTLDTLNLTVHDARKLSQES